MNKYESPNCQICDKKLKKERVDKMLNTDSEIVYFFCTTLLKEETKYNDAVSCNGRDHILLNV